MQLNKLEPFKGGTYYNLVVDGKDLSGGDADDVSCTEVSMCI